MWCGLVIFMRIHACKLKEIWKYDGENKFFENLVYWVDRESCYRQLIIWTGSYIENYERFTFKYYNFWWHTWIKYDKWPWEIQFNVLLSIKTHTLINHAELINRNLLLCDNAASITFE